MKRFLNWIAAPWRRVIEAQLTRERKAVLVGCLATAALLYGGWILFAGKDALDGRSAVGVFVAPDASLLREGQEEQTIIEEESRLCRLIAPVKGGPPEIIPDGIILGPARNGSCIDIRPPRPYEYTTQRSTGGDAVTVGPWQGDLEMDVPATNAIYRGNRRQDAVESVVSDVGDLFGAAVKVLGVVFAALVGVAAGHQYLGRKSSEDFGDAERS
jgi:hypothetical protein